MVDKNDLAKCLKTGHIFDTREAKKNNFEKLLKFFYVFHWIISSRIINLLLIRLFILNTKQYIYFFWYYKREYILVFFTNFCCFILSSLAHLFQRSFDEVFSKAVEEAVSVDQNTWEQIREQETVHNHCCHNCYKIKAKQGIISTPS